MRYISTKLNISESELNQYFNAKNKSYKDYKNQQYLYELGSNILKRIGYEIDIRR